MTLPANKYRVQERQPITERLQTIGLKSRLREKSTDRVKSDRGGSNLMKLFFIEISHKSITDKSLLKNRPFTLSLFNDGQFISGQFPGWFR